MMMQDCHCVVLLNNHHHQEQKVHVDVRLLIEMTRMTAPYEDEQRWLWVRGGDIR